MKPWQATIPTTPDRALSPNARVHWGVKSRKKHELRESVRLTVGSKLNPHGFKFPQTMMREHPLRITPQTYTLSWVIAWEKGRRKMDHDNSIAILKAAIDGVADALRVDDSQFRVGTVEQERDPEGRGYMVLTITPEHA